MSKTIDKKIKEFRKKFTGKRYIDGKTGWSSPALTKPEIVDKWLQQALSEVERESYNKGFSEGHFSLNKSDFELKGRT